MYLPGASAALFAGGLLTKFFVAEMLPVAVVAMLVPMGERGRPGGWMAAWLLIVAALFGAGCAAGRVDFGQTIGTHLHADGEGAKVLVSWLRSMTAWYIVVLGLLSLVMVRDWKMLVAWVWAAMSIGIVLLHRPLWYHHILLVSLPLVWIATVGIGAVVKWNRNAGIIVLLVLALMWPVKVWRESERLRAPAARGDWEIVAALGEGQGKWVIADRPMYAFYAGKRVPPEVAVLSEKRMGEGKMDEVVAEVMERYRAERVEVGRFGFEERVGEILREEYSLLMVGDRGKVYRRK